MEKSISERKYYFNYSRSDTVYQQNPVAFGRAGCHGYDEQYDWSDRYAACWNGIADVPLKTVFTKKRNYVSTVLRLIVYPVFILILMKLIYTFAGLNDSKQILLTVYIASITPACATVTSIAQLYDKDAAYASALYVLTTLLSIVTMPVMVGMYEIFV